MRSFRTLFDTFRGAGDAAVTIPSMDGSLRPNNLLDRADVVFEGRDDVVACIASDGRRCFFSCGRVLLSLGDDPDAKIEKVAECDGIISALAAHPSGHVAVGVSGKGLVLRCEDGTLAPIPTGGVTFDCPVALAFAGPDELIVANGSARNRPEHWRRDLMEKNRCGSIWRVDVKTGAATCLAKDLAYPCGVAVTDKRAVVVSEGWRHRVLTLDPDGRQSTVLDDLPGYPGAITPSRDGGYWLAVFAPRQQLVEFVLREDHFRKQMMATLEERHWVAPALKTGLDYFEPVQSGGVRHLGMVKPWAPTRSYGLIVRLDGEFNPLTSFHSRAGASRHGITAVAQRGDRVLAACAATNQLLAVDPNLTED
jgi:hypothetical protein